ncbi:MAG: hypothetical protein ACOVP8_00350, partial [Phycisphaerales bacterium]
MSVARIETAIRLYEGAVIAGGPRWNEYDEISPPLVGDTEGALLRALGRRAYRGIVVLPPGLSLATLQRAHHILGSLADAGFFCVAVDASVHRAVEPTRWNPEVLVVQDARVVVRALRTRRVVLLLLHPLHATFARFFVEPLLWYDPLDAGRDRMPLCSDWDCTSAQRTLLATAHLVTSPDAPVIEAAVRAAKAAMSAAADATGGDPHDRSHGASGSTVVELPTMNLHSSLSHFAMSRLRSLFVIDPRTVRDAIERASLPLFMRVSLER